MLHRREFLAASLAAAAATTGWPAARAQTGEPIRIGEINSYSRIPAFLLPYRNAWQLAVKEINDAGGVLGRPLEAISRDDGGEPGTAVRLAEELVRKEGVALLAGTYLSNVGLAVSDFAKQNKVLFVAAEPLTDALTLAQGHRYTFRLRPSTGMQAAMLVEEAAKLPARRWATVAPNYEYGQSAVSAFTEMLKAKRPEVAFVEQQWPPFGKLEAGPVVQALARANPEAIFNVTFAADLAKFVREGELRGLFRGREVVSLLTGEPEYLEPLKREAPEGWIVTGYPWYAIETPEHAAFLKAYQAAYNDHPYLGSVVGYTVLKAIAAAIARAGSTDTEALLEAMEGLEITSPFGPITFRDVDHQSTMGAYVGRTAVKDGQGVMVDWYYADGAEYVLPPEEVRKIRPAD